MYITSISLRAFHDSKRWDVWWFIFASISRILKDTYRCMFFHKSKFIIHTKCQFVSISYYEIFRSRTTENIAVFSRFALASHTYRFLSFSIWFMTVGDRLPGYPEVEKQFVSALDLIGISGKRFASFCYVYIFIFVINRDICT